MVNSGQDGKWSRLPFYRIFGYITEWRMLIDKQLVTESKDPIVRIAEPTGYQSEAAFSRVFKRHNETGPATYRRERQMASAL